MNISAEEARIQEQLLQIDFESGKIPQLVYRQRLQELYSKVYAQQSTEFHKLYSPEG